MDFASIKKQQEEFLKKAKSRKKPVAFNVEGIELIVNPRVFSPATDTKLLVSNIRTKKGERILDLTTGSGPSAIAAGLQGASGFAVDINPHAVKNANQNFKRYHIQMKAIKSNLFENVSNEKFDQIFANGPSFEGDITDIMDYACYGAKSFIENLFSSVRKYLKKDGKLLMVVSALVDLKHLKETAYKNSLKVKLIKTRKSDDGQRTYYLYKIN